MLPASEAEVEFQRRQRLIQDLTAAKSALLDACSIAKDRDEAQNLLHLWAEVDRALERVTLSNLARFTAVAS